MLSEKESGVLRDMLFHVDAAERFAHGQTFESMRDDSRHSLAQSPPAPFLRHPTRSV
jgi:hypothetical protein